jgi:hypothetical protein
MNIEELKKLKNQLTDSISSASDRKAFAGMLRPAIENLDKAIRDEAEKLQIKLSISSETEMEDVSTQLAKMISKQITPTQYLHHTISMAQPKKEQPKKEELNPTFLVCETVESFRSISLDSQEAKVMEVMKEIEKILHRMLGIQS